MRYVGDMRRCQYVVEGPEGVRRRQRLGVEYVDRRAGDLLVLQHADQSLLFDDQPARRIDQPGRWFHSLQFRGLVGAAELERMKPTARLINASRGLIVEEQALISVLKNKQIAGAAIDVFDTEPLPASHPFRTLDNVLATPHIGYVSHGLYKTFYEDTVSNIRRWLDTH